MKIAQVPYPESCVSAIHSLLRKRSCGTLGEFRTPTWHLTNHYKEFSDDKLLLSHGWCTFSRSECLMKLVYWHFSNRWRRTAVIFQGYSVLVARSKIHFVSNGKNQYLFCKNVFFFGRDAQHQIWPKEDILKFVFLCLFYVKFLFWMFFPSLWSEIGYFKGFYREMNDSSKMSWCYSKSVLLKSAIFFHRLLFIYRTNPFSSSQLI